MDDFCGCGIFWARSFAPRRTPGKKRVNRRKS
jgi:hypothetical protein